MTLEWNRTKQHQNTSWQIQDQTSGSIMQLCRWNILSSCLACFMIVARSQINSLYSPNAIWYCNTSWFGGWNYIRKATIVSTSISPTWGSITSLRDGGLSEFSTTGGLWSWKWLTWKVLLIGIVRVRLGLPEFLLPSSVVPSLLAADSSISRKTLSMYSPAPLVVVVDALDECDRDDYVRVINSWAIDLLRYLLQKP